MLFQHFFFICCIPLHHILPSASSLLSSLSLFLFNLFRLLAPPSGDFSSSCSPISSTIPFLLLSIPPFSLFPFIIHYSPLCLSPSSPRQIISTFYFYPFLVNLLSKGPSA